MLRALITILTLYNEDNTLFEDLELPKRPFTNRGYLDMYLEGYDLDKDTLINNLLLELAEMNVIYTDPKFMKFAISAWASKNFHVWQSLYETMFFKYNPIWNKDGTIKHTATETRDLTKGENGRREESETIVNDDTVQRTLNTELEKEKGTTETITHNTTDTFTKGAEYTIKSGEESHDTTHDNNGEITSSTGVNAFNANTDYVPKEQTVEEKTDGYTENVTISFDQRKDRTVQEDPDTNAKTGTETTVYNGSDTDTETGTITDDIDREQTKNNTVINTVSGTDEGTIENEFETQEYGNIGVTMSQALIEAERNLVKFNIYDYIINDFKNRFCILTY